MNDVDEARAEHTAALQAWIASRGDDEPPARERLQEAYDRLRQVGERR